MSAVRYRFAEFVVSPGQRLLLHGGKPQSLIPRYFDLLVLLLARRHEAVDRQSILDAVWDDVVVSEGALNQAVRGLRRVLGDDPRAPRYIRTVPRFGYQFVYPDVVEEPDLEPETAAGVPEKVTTATGRALAAVRRRGPAAALGGLVAGAVGGAVGASLLLLAEPSAVAARLLVVFALVGAIIGGLGAAGVGAGILVAETAVRRLRAPALVAAGALGGGLIGATSQLLASWTMEEIFGHRLSAAGGGLEGLAIGAAVGLGYVLATPRGEATSRRVALLGTSLFCALATLLLTWAGRPLGGVSLDVLARTFDSSHAGLAPLARLFGEPQLGPATRFFVGGCEGLLFGLGMGLGLTWRAGGEIHPLSMVSLMRKIVSSPHTK